MCVVSMVADHYRETLPQRYQWLPSPDIPSPHTSGTFFTGGVSQEEFDALKRDVEEMKALLKRAKEYDTATGQPDCEMDDKVAILRRVAVMVGVDLRDVLGPS